MKAAILYIIIFTTLIISACNQTYYDDEDCYDYDYSDCNTIEPTEGDLNIRLTINKENPEVEIIVYKGKYETQDTISKSIINDPLFKLSVPLNHYYSVRAKYTVGEKTIYAIDGCEIKSKSNSVCDSVCWEIKGGDMDVRLKYDK